MLENSGYTRFPVDRHIHIDKGDFDVQDDSPEFWQRAERVVTNLYDRLIHPEITARNGPSTPDRSRTCPHPDADEAGGIVGGQNRGNGA